MDLRYNAFISYRHHPVDIKVAEQIQRGLEHYRIPKALKKNKDTKLHLFRDKEELEASGADVIIENPCQLLDCINAKKEVE